MNKFKLIQIKLKNEKKFKFEKGPLKATKEMCIQRCQDLLKLKNYPWAKNENPIAFYMKRGNIKLGKNQRILINFLHKSYFSRGKPCFLKRINIIKQAKLQGLDKSNLTKTIIALVNHGILLKITGESNKQKTVFILPNIYLYIEKEPEKQKKKSESPWRGGENGL
jgi:hypothetical protein